MPALPSIGWQERGAFFPEHIASSEAELRKLLVKYLAGSLGLAAQQFFQAEPASRRGLIQTAALMRKFIAFFLAIALPGAANACQCAFPLLDTESVRDAKNIFIFRLLSAELQLDGSDQPLTTMVTGRIQVVDTIRGNTTAKTIRYSTHQCCGTRLDVGKYYAAFAPEPDSEFLGNNGNLLEVGETYYPKSGSRTKIESVISGRRSLEEAFSEYALDRTQQIPRPPAPYCPNGNKQAP